MRNLKEVSAGGIVLKNGQLLLVLMRNSKDGVWTYPKGHVEEHETLHEAAIREVFEETGYKCEITEKKEIYISRYSFYRNNRFVEKNVHWYQMQPLSRFNGIQTPDEIMKTAWVSIEKAARLLTYKSDFEILELVRKKLGG